MDILKIIIINPKIEMLIQIHFLGDSGGGKSSFDYSQKPYKKITIINIKEIDLILERM